MPQWQQLWRNEDGQDLTEYALLLALIVLTTAAIVTAPMPAVNQIWEQGNSELSIAASTAAPF
jgi:Flp pilus assembly pilin Flp